MVLKCGSDRFKTNKDRFADMYERKKSREIGGPWREYAPSKVLPYLLGGPISPWQTLFLLGIHFFPAVYYSAEPCDRSVRPNGIEIFQNSFSVNFEGISVPLPVEIYQSDCVHFKDKSIYFLKNVV
jgi:hypothetical protein